MSRAHVLISVIAGNKEYEGVVVSSNTFQENASLASSIIGRKHACEHDYTSNLFSLRSAIAKEANKAFQRFQ